MVIGFDPDESSFFWFVGQGGTGIMTSPGTGRLLSDLMTEGKPSEHFNKTGLNYEDVSPERLRKNKRSNQNYLSSLQGDDNL